LRESKNLASSLLKGFVLLGTILLVVIAFLCVFKYVPHSNTSASTGWYNSSWHYRKEITIDHTKVPNTDQLNFPVLISLTDSDLQVHARNDGHDILFTDSTGTTKIPYEREQYVNSSGTLVAWVKVATLKHSTNTAIYMYYGNSKASDQQDLTDGTWDANFKGVWHSDDASTTTIADSTTNANTGTKYGTTEPVETTGKIGKAQSYDGIDNYVSVSPSGILSGSFTVSVWAKILDDESRHTVIGTRNDGDNSFDFKFNAGKGGRIIHGDIGDGTDWITNEADVTDFTYVTDTWYQVTYTVTTTGYTIYIDGDPVASGSYPESAPLLFDSTHNIFIGQVGYDDEWFNGVIDEVRISNTARSSDWIQTEYNNQNNPSAFYYSLGSETAGDIAAPSVPGIPQATIDTNLTSQDWSWTASTDTGSGMSHYDWWVDGGPSGTTTTPTVTTNLKSGNWKFHVKAEDNANNQSAEQSSLLAVFSSHKHRVVVDCSVPLVQVVTPANVSDPVLDLSQITVSNGKLLVASTNCGIFLETLLPSITITVDIPPGVTIKGPSTLWSDRAIVPPVITTTTPPPAPSGLSSQITLAVEIGHNVAPLEITKKGVRIFLSGQAGKKVGYISSNVFTEITSTCAGDSQIVGNALAKGKDCKIESGSDLIIWTKHLSKFIIYKLVTSSTNTPTTTPTTPQSNTSSSIKAPTNLTAADVPNDTGGVIEINWTASKTANISGYHIFRSQKEESDFTLIGVTDKDIVRFIDTNATTDQKFYYFVRAYKDQHESTNSNTVSATSIKNRSIITTESIIGGACLLLLIVGSIVFLVLRKRRKDQTSTHPLSSSVISKNRLNHPKTRP